MGEITDYVKGRIGQRILYGDINLNYCYDSTLEVSIRKGQASANIIYPVEDVLITPLEVMGFLRSQAASFGREFKPHSIYMSIEGEPDDYIDFRDRGFG